MQYKKYILLLVLIWKINTLFSQPVYPGALTFIVLNNNDTLRYDKFTVFKTDCFSSYGYLNKDTFSISIYKSFLGLEPLIEENYVTINSGSSLEDDYSIKAIMITKNAKDSMLIYFDGASNTHHYFLNILFQVGKYHLEIEKINKERYNYAVKKAKYKCKNIKNLQNRKDCKDNLLKNEILVIKNDVSRRIIDPPYGWSKYLNK